MLLRALLLLALVAGGSILLTYALGAKVLLALGLMLAQIKVLWKTLLAIDAPAILAWLKMQANAFAKIELLKKWLMTSVMPLLVGRAALRQVEAFVARYFAMIRAYNRGLMQWYRGLDWYVKLIAALIVLFATLGLAVSSIGLWLILFSVQLPFWLLATFSATVHMVSATVQKMVFRAVAFLHLNWAWRLLKRQVPPDYLEQKRRFEFRVARRVVRRRRMTLRQLTNRDHALGLRVSLLVERLRSTAPPPPQGSDSAENSSDCDQKER